MKKAVLLLCSLFSFYVTHSIQRETVYSGSGACLGHLEVSNEEIQDEETQESLETRIAEFSQYILQQQQNLGGGVVVVVKRRQPPSPLLFSQILAFKFLQAGLGAGLIKVFSQCCVPPLCLGFLAGNHLAKDFQLEKNAGIQKLTTGVLAGSLLYLCIRPTEQNFARIITTCGIGFTACQLMTHYIKKQ